MPPWTKTEFDQFYNFKAEKQGHWNGRPGIKLHYHDWSVGQWQRSEYAPLLASVLGLVSGDSVILVGAGFNWTGEGLEALGIDVLGTDISTYIHNEKGNTEEAEIRQYCLDAGVDPDVDKIYCLPTDPGAALTLDSNRVAATVNWLTDPNEAENRTKWIAEHGPLPSVAEVSSVPNEHLGNWQWARDPLDVFLRGGRASPQPRGHGNVMDEELRVRGSRNRVWNQLQNLGFTDPRYVITEEVLNSITDAEALNVCDYISTFKSEHPSIGTCVHMLSPLQPGVNQAPELNWKTYAEWRTFLDTNGFADQLILPTVTVFPDIAYGGLI